ncbi:MAG: ArsR/SmtB family transcription factor [bacterium]
MGIRELMELAAGDVNFRILRSLHDKPLYAGDLSERLNVHIRTIRVHLHRLRTNDFLAYDQDGRKHLYHIKTPFESTEHELIITLVSLADPVKKRGENQERLDVADASLVAQKIQKGYWTTLIKGVYRALVHQGSIGELKKLRRELEKISNRADRLVDDQ